MIYLLLVLLALIAGVILLAVLATMALISLADPDTIRKATDPHRGEE